MTTITNSILGDKTMKHFVSFFLLSSVLYAKILTAPIDSMQFAFGTDIDIEKRNILLTSKQAHDVQKLAKTKLSTKIYQVYKASKEKKVLAYGILVSQKVRSKNCVVMYHITKNGHLRSIEIIAFNEPIEYLPNKRWLKLFHNRSVSKPLYLTKQIPTITGATLSAHSITNAARIAFAIYNVLLRK